MEVIQPLLKSEKDAWSTFDVFDESLFSNNFSKSLIKLETK
jgi:hypothetical protein